MKLPPDFGSRIDSAPAREERRKGERRVKKHGLRLNPGVGRFRYTADRRKPAEAER